MTGEPEKETPIATVERLAALARIIIPEDRRESLAGEFADVLAYIAQLDELTLSVGGTPVLPAVHNVFRKDIDAYKPGTFSDDIVRAFPAKAGNALSVKKILTHD